MASHVHCVHRGVFQQSRMRLMARQAGLTPLAVIPRRCSQVQKVHNERATLVEGSNIKPLLKFEHTGLPSNVMHATRDFVAPSPIQSQCWPIIMSGHDLIGIAATGSGKTLGFGLPMLAHIAAQKEAGVVKGKVRPGVG